MSGNTMKLSQGNPGAINVILQVAENNLILEILDKNQIYGSKIWFLYKYICDNSIDKMTSLLIQLNENNSNLEIDYKENKINLLKCINENS